MTPDEKEPQLNDSGEELDDLEAGESEEDVAGGLKYKMSDAIVSSYQTGSQK